MLDQLDAYDRQPELLFGDSHYDSEQDRTVTEMNPSFCATCDFCDQCPVKKVRDSYIVTHSPAQHRLAARRAEQSTVAFAENYSIRGGGESVNTGLKRKTGMGNRLIPRLTFWAKAISGSRLLFSLLRAKRRSYWLGSFSNERTSCQTASPNRSVRSCTSCCPARPGPRGIAWDRA